MRATLSSILFLISIPTQMVLAANDTAQPDIPVQVGIRRCSSNYSLSCFKADVVRTAAEQAPETRLELATGVSLVATESTNRVARDSVDSLAFVSTTRQLDEHLINSLDAYLGSLNLTIQLQESGLLPSLRTITDEVFTGRGRKSSWYAVGTVAAVGFALLAALAGKALMASMFALLMTGLTALRGNLGGGGGGGGGGNLNTPFAAPAGRITQYEIIAAKPAFATGPAHYVDHDHHGAYTTAYRRALDAIQPDDMKQQPNEQ